MKACAAWLWTHPNKAPMVVQCGLVLSRIHAPLPTRNPGGNVKLSERLQDWAQALRREVVALWFVSRHPETPLAAKLLAVLTVAYAFSPIDLIPDFIPVLGYLDELILVPLAIYLTLRLVPPQVLEECRRHSEHWLRERRSRPRSHAAAIVIILIWLFAFALLLKCTLPVSGL